MRVLAWVGLTVLFVIGALIGLALGVVAIFWVSLYRGKRAVHADGVLCRAEVTSTALPELAGSALVRLSGAFEGEVTTGSDVLGFDIRFQRAAVDDARAGDQDLLLGSFESFHTAAHDRTTTDAGDFLTNTYSTVTPWWTPGRGACVFHVSPIAPAQPRDRAPDRTARLDADIAAKVAVLALRLGDEPIAELRLVARLTTVDQRTLHASMFRTGRHLRPLGVRNGIRATVYPISEFARRLRGG